MTAKQQNYIGRKENEFEKPSAKLISTGEGVGHEQSASMNMTEARARSLAEDRLAIWIGRLIVALASAGDARTCKNGPGPLAEIF